MNHGVDINKADRKGRTPFLVAVTRSNIDIAELLTKSSLHDVNVNKLDDQGMTPLMNVCKSEGKQSLIRFLLSKGACVNAVGKNDLTALKVACEAENWECVDFLLEKGAVFIKDCTVKKMLLDNSKVLVTACKDGLKYILNEFLSPAFDLNSIIEDKFTLLMHACSKGNDEIVHILCNKGADVNKINKNGLFPLMIALKNQYIDTVTLLIDHGAIVDLLYKNKCTPLMFACQEGMLSGVKILVSKGANNNISINKLTPLSFACKNEPI
ncbi:unnamed protein product [Mytilus edulis]|uniref:Uncharacterized protein n=1 Tax=Mytilus edulis TaxID=6550 RepID=A0A8S3VJB2_MYTED|nr:unnamed protein product [Mytilus edulis]